MKKDFLESLIDVLTPSEKGYINEHLSMRNKENNFSILFNTVSSKKKNITLNNNLNSYYVTRTQLKDKIFKLLRMYHSDVSREQALKCICMDVEILFNKGVLSHCLDLIEYALKISRKNEWFELELYLLSWRQKTFFTLTHAPNLEMEFKNNQKMVNSVLLKLNNYHYHRRFMYDIFIIRKKIGIVKHNSESVKLNKIIKSYEQSQSPKPLSYRAKICRYLFYVYYYTVSQEHNLCYKYAKKHLETVKLFEKFSGRSLPESLYAALNFTLICEINLKKYAALQKSLKQIREINFDSLRGKAQSFGSSYCVETDMYIQFCRFDKIKQVLPAIKKGLETYEHLLNNEQKSVLYSNIAYLFFCSSEYKLSLNWNNKIIAHRHLLDREDIDTATRILNLILHFELNHNDLLEHLLLSTFRYFYKKKRIYEIENTIMRFLRNQLKYYTPPKEIHQSFEKLLNEIKHLSKRSGQKNLFIVDLDIISWLESKIQNRPFAEIVKEKANTR